jgi:hypothetical protein
MADGSSARYSTLLCLLRALALQYFTLLVLLVWLFHYQRTIFLLSEVVLLCLADKSRPGS